MKAWLFFGLVLLAGCKVEAESEQTDASHALSAERQPVPDGDRLSKGTLGPIRYGYDSSRLVLTEVTLRIPPDDREQSWALKLIPASRAALLGQRLCGHDDIADQPQPCTAEQEAGLALAFLERPLSAYRAAFEHRGFADRLVPASLNGAQGFAFKADGTRSCVRYHFVGVSGRTLLMARHPAGLDMKEHEAIEAVISSIAEQL